MSKIAVVTGAGTGVGRAAALALLADGWKVALSGRRREPLEETAQMSGAAQNALVQSCDVGDPVQVNALFAAVKAAHGRLDFLFNNAGGNVPAQPIEDLKYEDWCRVVQVNLTGSFLCAQAAFRAMKEQAPQGGRICNNGSISAHVPRPDSVAYTSTKHAITGLTRQLALDGRKYDICSSQIDIGNAATPMTDRMVQGAGVKQASGEMKIEPRMDAKHVGSSVLMIANLPLDANIQFLTIAAPKMPWIARG